jgi:hypothetical protein
MNSTQRGREIFAGFFGGLSFAINLIGLKPELGGSLRWAIASALVAMALMLWEPPRQH